MNRSNRNKPILRSVVAGFALTIIGAGAMPPAKPSKPDAAAPRPSVDEARERAKLLHGTLHDTLQIVHSRYYREDEGLEIPAGALKLVFQGLSERNGIELHWLAVDAQAMNIDHKPRDEFEKQAVKALASGKDEYELAERGVYRHVGPITLGADCLKCHLPSRSNNNSRRAGLVIEIPVEDAPAP
jgi:hypothetical protein